MWRVLKQRINWLKKLGNLKAYWSSCFIFKFSDSLLISFKKKTVVGNGLAVQSPQLLLFLEYMKELLHGEERF